MWPREKKFLSCGCYGCELITHDLKCFGEMKLVRLVDINLILSKEKT